MMIRLISGLTILLAAPCVLGQDTIPKSRLTKLQRATVFVKVSADGRRQTGTGFVIHRSGRVGYIATNAHVVAGRSNTSPKIEIVFASGTKQEHTEAATLCYADDERDLAILKTDALSLPTPIFTKSDVELRETLPVYILGFPFGETLAFKDGNPQVTISRGSISSIRQGPDDAVTAIQLDGELNPGNSGGPVVDAAGTLLGIAVAKVGGTNIGFAVPADALTALLVGFVSKTSVTQEVEEPGLVKLTVGAELVDPLGKLKKVAVVLAPGDKSTEKPSKNPRGEFLALPGGREYPLKLGEGTAQGEFKLRGKKDAEVVYLLQTKYVRADGKTVYAEPGELHVSFGSQPSSGDALSVLPEEDFGQPAAPLAEETVTSLPGAVKDVALAGGGRYLVLKLQGIPGLAIYDLFEAEIAKIIRLPSTEFILAAGGRTAVVYFVEDNILQSWDLQTYEKIKTKPNPIPGVITAMVMGHSRSDLAMVRHAVSTDSLARSTNFLLHTATLKPVQHKGETYFFHGRNSSYRDNVHLRADSDLEFVTEWATSHSPSGVGIYARSGSTFTHKYEHDSAGCLAMGDDGRIYSSGGTIYTSGLVKRGQLRGQVLFPAIGGSLVLGMDKDAKLTIYEPGKTTPIGPWGSFPEWEKGDRSRTRGRGHLSQDKRIVFGAVFGRVAFIPLEADRIILRPFDLQATLDASGIDYLVVTSTPPLRTWPGREWSYQVEAISKTGSVTFELELAPEGMTISDEGLITWKPPASTEAGTEKIVLLVSDQSGEQTYHTFDLTVAR